MQTYHITESPNRGFEHFSFPPFDVTATDVKSAETKARVWLHDWRRRVLGDIDCPVSTVWVIKKVQRQPVSIRLANPHSPMDETNEAVVIVGNVEAGIVRRYGPVRLVENGDFRGFPEIKQTFRLSANAAGPIGALDGREWICSSGLHEVLADIRTAITNSAV